MENTSGSAFINLWHYIMMAGAPIMAAAGIVIYITHKLRVAAISDYKSKYDYLNAKEIKNYKLVALCFAIAAMMAINLYGQSSLDGISLWFFVRLFISICGGTLVGYVSYLVLDYYYPTVLSRKLKKWRYMPRTNPKTGNTMRLLSEEEEDVHLEEGMQAEENVFSIDYDVWIDEQSGEVQIEKYPGHLQAFKCNSCGFFTMRVVREEIIEQPYSDMAGELIKHYQCSYCKSVRATAFNISTKAPEDYKAALLEPTELKNKHKDIEMVRIEIYSAVSGKEYFEFQNTEQARKFLKEYDEKD